MAKGLCHVGSITSRCSGKLARTHPLSSGRIKDRTWETAEIEPICHEDIAVFNLF